MDLRSVLLFSGLDDVALAALRSRLTLRRYRKGEIIMRAGAYGDSMFIIRSGQLQVFAEGKDGATTIITHLSPGLPVGEQALLLGERRSANVRVSIEAELWELKKRDFEDLFIGYSSFALSFSRELARRINRTTRQPKEQEITNLLAILGTGISQLVTDLAYITGERIILLDLGGLSAGDRDVDPIVTLSQMDPNLTPEALATRLGVLINQYDRVLMAIPPYENALSRKAAEQAEVIIELNNRSTPWVKRFARDGRYWHQPLSNGGLTRMARRIARRRVGLALSSGSAWSIAHIGVLRVLEREGFPIDMIAGTSGGGLFGGLYAIGKSLDEVEAFARSLARISSPRSGFGGLADINIPPRHGLVKGHKLMKWLEQNYEHKDFSEAVIPLKVIACDVILGEEVVFDSGPIAEGIRATFSIVPLFDPAYLRGRWLIDGAAVNPVPTSVLRDHVDIIIASSVIASIEERQSRKVLIESGKLPNIFALMFGKEGIMESGIIQSKMGHVDVLIQPDVALYEASDFSRIDEFIAAGEEAAEKAIASIKGVLQPQPRSPV
ncbi:MAG: cyclic nucleotide-binding domain-containing protein [Ardenticatenales bacterium]|nr:cyclic nucleotide-binding domain-containing protein [Ardenticatenales bacterium]